MPAIIQIHISWILLLLAFIGHGLLFQRLLGLRPSSSEKISLADSFWIGWLGVIVILQLWNIFFPVNAWANVLIFGLGWGSVLLHSDGIIAGLKEFFIRHKYGIVVLVILAWWISTQALQPPRIYDNGLYHYNMIRWAMFAPTVPGLTNLQVHLGYGPYFLYPALLEAGLWFNRSHHVANSILILGLLSQIFINILCLLRSSEIKVSHLFSLAIFPALLTLPLEAGVSSPTADVIIFSLGVLLTLRLLDGLDQNAFNARDLFFITVIGFGGMIMKLNFVFFGGTAILIAYLHTLLAMKKAGSAIFKTSVVRAIICFILFIVPWIARNIIWSGYPFYPAPLLPLPVEWRLPYDTVLNFNKWIRSWSRIPFTHWSNVLGNKDWIYVWWDLIIHTQIFRFVYPALLTVTASLAGLICSGMSIGKGMFRQRSWIALLPSVIMLIFWFKIAPDVRFAGASFWVLGAGSATLVVIGLREITNKTRKMIIFALSLVLMFKMFYYPIDYYLKLAGEQGFSKLLLAPWGQDFIPAMRVPLKKFTTDSGLILNVPVQGDQCWDAPLPCTPYPHAHLRLRKEGSIKNGFVVLPRNEGDISVGHHP